MPDRQSAEYAAGEGGGAASRGRPRRNASPKAGFDGVVAALPDSVEPRDEFLHAFSHAWDGDEFVFN